jgi:hypothetical protein
MASFTAIFFIKDKGIGYIALFLIASSAIITSLISATIVPVGDTQRYIESFQDINLFDFTELALENKGFEPFYKIYEYFLSFFIDDNQHLFLLITALILNSLSTIAILRICLRLNQLKLSCIILAIYYSLVAPALGVPLFLLRSSLSLSILLLAISFYSQIPILFYALGIIAIFIHYSSLLIFGALLLKNHLSSFSKYLQYLGKKIFFISLSQTTILRIYLIILATGFFIVIVTPNLMNSVLEGTLAGFGDSGALASGKTRSFLDKGAENFVDFTNPVFIIQILISLLCFLKLPNGLLNRLDIDDINKGQISNFLEGLRLIGRFLLLIIIFTAPFNVLPYRLGFFNFLYFPLWLVNVPFLSLQAQGEKKFKYLIVFALICVLAYTFYWMPKRQVNEYFITVLEGKPLSYNLAEIITQFL